MNIFRRFGLNLTTLLFSTCISLLVVLMSVFFVFDTPGQLKEALRTSGIYNTPISDAVGSQGSDALSSLPLNNPGVQQAFGAALPPMFLQQSSEQIIDGTYNWVHGTTAEPAFSVDLAPVKQNFANSLALYIQQKLDALPTCTQIVNPPNSIEALLALTCMPYGATSASIADSVRQEALASHLFSDNDTLSTTTLKNGQATPLTHQLAFVPQLHRYYVLALYLLPILILLLAAAVVYLSDTKRAGSKRLAWLLITTGVTTIILAATGMWLLHTGITLFAPTSTSPLQTTLFTLLEILMTSLRVWWFGFGAGYTIIGSVILVVIKMNPPKPSLVMSGSQQPFVPPTPITQPFDEPSHSSQQTHKK